VLPLLLLAIGARTPTVPDRPVVCVAGDQAAIELLLRALREGGRIDGREDDGLCNGLLVRVTHEASGLALETALRGEPIERRVGSPTTAAALVETWTLGESVFPAAEPTLLERISVGEPSRLSFALDFETGAASNQASWNGVALAISRSVADGGVEFGGILRLATSGGSDGSLFYPGTAAPFFERDHRSDFDLLFKAGKRIELGPLQLTPELALGVGYGVLSADVVGGNIQGTGHDSAYGLTPRLEGALTLSTHPFHGFAGRLRVSITSLPADPSDFSSSTMAVFRLGLGVEYDAFGSGRWDE
jgi:hypothetical protein